jgi:hypothetical protein
MKFRGTYFENVFLNKLEHLEKMDTFLDAAELPN